MARWVLRDDKRTVDMQKVLAEDKTFEFKVSSGGYDNLSSLFKFGRHPSVGAVEEVVWDGQDNYTFLEAAETLDIVSTNSEDNSNGLGSHTILVQGLDENYNEIQDIITMTGITPVTTTNLYLRVFRAIVLTSGTNSAIGNSNFGDITFITSTTTTLQAKILIGNGQTLMAVYTIPAGKTGYVTGIGASTPAGKSCLLKAKIRNGEAPNSAFSVKYTIDLFEQAISQNLVTPLRIPEKTDLCFTAQSTAVGTPVSASFGMILLDGNETRL